jgi:hypothetical protein
MALMKIAGRLADAVINQGIKRYKEGTKRR